VKLEGGSFRYDPPKVSIRTRIRLSFTSSTAVVRIVFCTPCNMHPSQRSHRAPVIAQDPM
jgi:hypothetical protein